jgi:hypothetical protein
MLHQMLHRITHRQLHGSERKMRACLTLTPNRQHERHRL